jgi:predicted O-methyltransferase YrrM
MGPAAKVAGRQLRRALGLAHLRSAQVSGTAPTAVLAAVKAAFRNTPSAAERAWISRIEQMRTVMASSPRELAITDFGAGARSEFDVGEFETEHTTTRTLAEMTGSSKPAYGAYLLFRLVRSLRPATALELGACVGVSASYIAAAMELNDFGRMMTLEGAEVLADRSRRTLEELLLTNRAEVRQGRFSDVLDSALADLAPLEMAFVDGHHIESATIDYMNAILTRVSDEALLVFDDISWSAGMRRAWNAIAADNRFALTVDLRSVGLAVVSDSATSRQALSVAYY